MQTTTPLKKSGVLVYLLSCAVVVVVVVVVGVGCSLLRARHTMPRGAVGNPLIDH